MSQVTATKNPTPKPTADAIAALLGILSGQNGPTIDSESIVSSHDSKIHLPKPLDTDLNQASAWLLKINESQKKAVSLHHQIDGFHPVDAGVTLMRALKKRYGFVSLKDTPTFFGPRPPTMFLVRTGPGPADSEQMVFGKMQVPGLGDSVTLDIQINWSESLPAVLVIGGECEVRHQAAVEELVAYVRSELQHGSIYRGRAISVSWEWAREGHSYDLTANCPQFIDASRADPSKLTYTDSAARQLDANVYAPIRLGDAYLAAGFSKKTGVLMYGPPGCGKSETLLNAAKLCEEKGWTYIQCGNVEDLKQAVEMAVAYQPAVIACEDVDRITEDGRTLEVDDLLNVIDGIHTKGKRLLFVMTTNDVDSITEAMLRPGRLGDGFVHLGKPDAAIVEVMVRKIARESLPANADLTEVGAALAGNLPAVISACVESARKYAICRTNGASTDIVPSDILDAFTERAEQVRLLTPEKPDVREVEIRASETLGRVLGDKIAEGLAVAASHASRLLVPLPPTVSLEDKPEPTVRHNNVPGRHATVAKG